MTDLNCPRQNHLIDALPAAVYERLFPLLELVPMPLGEVLYESGDKLRYVYFPTTCIVSMLYVILNGASAEIALVTSRCWIGRDWKRGSVNVTKWSNRNPIACSPLPGVAH